MSSLSSRESGSTIDPWRAVAVAQRFQGEAASSDFPRLTDVLAAQHGSAQWPARFDLRFGQGPDARPVALGQVDLTARLVCQRCLGEVQVLLGGPIAVGLIRSDAEAEGLPDQLDPVVVDADGIRPLDLVEDELLLTLPSVPVHDHCVALAPGFRSDAAPRRENPFRVLAGLQRPGAGPDEGGEG
jgi:uncharacterized protein